MKRYIFFAFLVAFLSLFPSRLRPNPDEKSRVAVLFTGDVNGYVEPCG